MVENKDLFRKPANEGPIWFVRGKSRQTRLVTAQTGPDALLSTHDPAQGDWGRNGGRNRGRVSCRRHKAVGEIPLDRPHLQALQKPGSRQSHKEKHLYLRRED